MWPPYKLHGWGSYKVSCWMALCWHWGFFLNAKSFCKTQIVYSWWFCPLTQITLSDYSVKFKFEMLFFKTLTTLTVIKLTSLTESSGALLRHPGSLNRECSPTISNILISQVKEKKKNTPIFCLWADCSVSRSFSAPQRGPHGQMAGDSCYLLRKHEGLLSSETRVCVRVSVCGVLCGVLVWWRSVHGSLLGTSELSPEPAVAGCSRFPPGLHVSACRLPPQTGTWMQKNTH